MKNLYLTIFLSFFVIAFTSQSNAALISGQDIIIAPEYAWDDAPGAENTHQQAFNEAQNVILTRDIEVDDGLLTAGTLVSSHMIFLNTPGSSTTSDNNVDWVFDGVILGVMSDGYGTLEAASNDILGASGTDYPASFNARGMESADSYIISGNSIRVSMHVSEPGDWIRVVTAGTTNNVPEPSMIGLLLSGIISLLGFKSIRKKNVA
ncbi:MAG: PEP-CTERM sorting domain-containing protein [Candidatus Atribacteria bacterium]|nr:PEP-CTERM sorting domain-containing protein [Candidatus Atribacteria bacterium]